MSVGTLNQPTLWFSWGSVHTIESPPVDPTPPGTADQLPAVLGARSSMLKTPGGWLGKKPKEGSLSIGTFPDPGTSMFPVATSRVNPVFTVLRIVGVSEYCQLSVNLWSCVVSPIVFRPTESGALVLELS